ncbi:MAG: FAD-binding oxidoreductase [Candidatus Obscuribacterales bacterium]|nr:FAD-binding oxidoreductase [Candidatus Obscuribacterales bacterium]
MISDQAFQPTANLEPNAVLCAALAQSKVILQGSQLNKALTRICDGSSDSIVRVDLGTHQQIVEYEPLDQVISVETGIKIDQLNQILQPNNQYFPCSGNSQQSVLDVINSGDCGHLEHSNSGMRSLILGLTIALPSGEIIKTGGKVVKNVSGYDLTKLFVGSRGTLGLPFQAHLRLFARPEQSVTMTFIHKQYEVLQDCLTRLLKNGLPLTGCEFFVGNALPQSFHGVNLIDVMSGEQPCSVLFLNVAEHQSVIAELIPQIESYMTADGIASGSCNVTVFAELENYFSDSEWTVETSLCQDKFGQLQSKLINSGINCHYRPGNGRVKILAKDEAEVQLVSNCLKIMASLEQPLIVASAREKYEYFVEQYPAEDANLSAIKTRIKTQFDPNNQLNPFAHL